MLQGWIMTRIPALIFGGIMEIGVYTSSYRRPYCQLEYSLFDRRAGFDRGLTSSYSRAG